MALGAHAGSRSPAPTLAKPPASVPLSPSSPASLNPPKCKDHHPDALKAVAATTDVDDAEDVDERGDGDDSEILDEIVDEDQDEAREHDKPQVEQTPPSTSTPNTRSRAHARAKTSSPSKTNPPSLSQLPPSSGASQAGSPSSIIEPQAPQSPSTADVEASAPPPDLPNDTDPTSALPSSTYPKDKGPSEYETGLIKCPQCAAHVAIRDPDTGEFTVRVWEEHRVGCFPQNKSHSPSLHPSHPHLASHHHAHPPSDGLPRGLATNSTHTPIVSSNGSRRAPNGVRVSNDNGLNASEGGDTNHYNPLRAPPSNQPHPHPRAQRQVQNQTPSNQRNASQGQAQDQQPKRRRAKRTEDERIEYLRADPYVATFEAYRVLCASCDKWIRLRPNSTYCSIPWDAHRKSCLAKKISNKNAYAQEERRMLFEKDPDVRKFDPERVLCGRCDTWLRVPADDHPSAVQTWLGHRAGCVSAPPSTSPLSPLDRGAGVSTSVTASLQRTSFLNGHGGGSAADSATLSGQRGGHRHADEPPSRPRPLVPGGPGGSPAVERSPASGSLTEGDRECAQGGMKDGGKEVRGWNDLTPEAFAPRSEHGHRHGHPPSAHALDGRSFYTHPQTLSQRESQPLGQRESQSHESRRRNADQRAASLRSDPLIAHVEPNRVFCTLCGKWVQLRQDSSFCAYPWVQHRGKCLTRFQRRAQKAAEVDKFRGQSLREGRGTTAVEEDELISDSVSSTPGPDAPPPPTSPLTTSLTTATGRRIKHEADDDASLIDLEAPSAKRRRVDGAPHAVAHRPRREYQRTERNPNYPYASPYTVDARASLGHGRPWKPTPAPVPQATTTTTTTTAGAGYVNGARGRSMKRRGEDVPQQQREDHDEDMDAGADADMDRDAEGDVDAEGEAEDDEIQVLAHHPAPSVHYRPHVELGGRALAMPLTERGEGRRGSLSGRRVSLGYTHSHSPVVSSRHQHPHPFHHHSHSHPHSHNPHHLSSFSASVDLDTPPGRKSFVLHSIQYLFSTTYEASDDLPIASLLAYVNTAMPVDKYEDFDTGEVTRWVGAGVREGRVRLEGDVVRVGV